MREKRDGNRKRSEIKKKGELKRKIKKKWKNEGKVIEGRIEMWKDNEERERNTSKENRGEW